MNREEFIKKASMISYTDIIDPKNISIASMWKMYSSTCLSGKQYSGEQYAELQTTFCVGFIEAFKLLTDIAGDMEEGEACKLFDAIAKESNRIADIKLKLKGVIR